MKQTIVGIFETPLGANETVHVLKSAGFASERIPRQAGQQATDELRPLPSRVVRAIARRIRGFMGADIPLSPFARALAQGRFVVRVHASHACEAVAARKILEAAGAREIDSLTDEWGQGQGHRHGDRHDRGRSGGRQATSAARPGPGRRR